MRPEDLVAGIGDVATRFGLGGLIPEGMKDTTMVPGGSGMVPLEPSPEATKRFVNSPLINKAMGVQNVGNVPMGEALRLATNSGIMPPETTAPSMGPQIPTFIMPPSNAPKSAIDLAKEDAVAEYNAWKSQIDTGLIPTHGSAVMPSGKIVEGTQGAFRLSPLFFANHPEVGGGVHVLGDKGPQFFFTSNKPKQGADLANDLIGKYVAAASDLLAGKSTSGNPLYDADVLSRVTGPLAAIMSAQTGAGLMPSQIAQNTANANRPQMGIFPTGPEGQHGGFLFPPGGQPQQFTSGSPAVSEKNTITGLMNQGYLEYMKESYKIDADPLSQPEQKAAAHAALQNRFRDYINALPQITGTGTATGRKMTSREYYDKARARGFSDEQIQREAVLLLQQGKIVR